ncbi:hypothetical protein, partial [Neisseria sp. P0013.S004]|uniref:hypothetical protein n=1 Tax=Neisseria sp. P0013.S004 TaxID=3436740 RepID=UPI003F7E41E6
VCLWCWVCVVGGWGVVWWCWVCFVWLGLGCWWVVCGCLCWFVLLCVVGGFGLGGCWCGAGPRREPE